MVRRVGRLVDRCLRRRPRRSSSAASARRAHRRCRRRTAAGCRAPGPGRKMVRATTAVSGQRIGCYGTVVHGCLGGVSQGLSSVRIVGMFDRATLPVKGRTSRLDGVASLDERPTAGKSAPLEFGYTARYDVATALRSISISGLRRRRQPSSRTSSGATKAVLAEQGIHLVGKNGMRALPRRDGSARASHSAATPDPRIPGSWNSPGRGRAASEDPARRLISHEIFAGCRSKHIARLAADLAGADLHIIYTARDLGRQLPAVWQEGLKNRSTTDLRQFLDETLDPDRSEAQAGSLLAGPTTGRRSSSGGRRRSTPERIHVLTAPPSGARSPPVVDGSPRSSASTRHSST